MQIIYEHPTTWPDEGTLHLEVPPLAVDIAVSPEQARRRANRYLGEYVAMALSATDPKLVLGSVHPAWRVSITLFWQPFGAIATLGSLDVDALTREILPLSSEQIETLQHKANDLITRLSLQTEAAG